MTTNIIPNYDENFPYESPADRVAEIQSHSIIDRHSNLLPWATFAYFMLAPRYAKRWYLISMGCVLAFFFSLSAPVNEAISDDVLSISERMTVLSWVALIGLAYQLTFGMVRQWRITRRYALMGGIPMAEASTYQKMRRPDQILEVQAEAEAQQIADAQWAAAAARQDREELAQAIAEALRNPASAPHSASNDIYVPTVLSTGAAQQSEDHGDFTVTDRRAAAHLLDD